VHKLELTPEDKLPWYLGAGWFSESILADKKELFSGFVNIVAQHDVFWKLDEPIPGSKTCMYMHPAEVTACRGISDIGDIYEGLSAGLFKCRHAEANRTQESYNSLLFPSLPPASLIQTKSTHSILALLFPAGRQSSSDEHLASCMLEHLAPQTKCILKEHNFAVGMDMSALASGHANATSIDMPAFASDIAKIFGATRLSKYPQDVAWLKEQTGRTRTVPLTRSEANKLATKREASMAAISATLAEKRAVVDTHFDKLLDELAKGRPTWEESAETYLGPSPGGGLTYEEWHLKEQTLAKKAAHPLLAQRAAQVEAITDQADEKRAAFEATVVKHVENGWWGRDTLTDAKPDPVFDRKWVCTA